MRTLLVFLNILGFFSFFPQQNDGLVKPYNSYTPFTQSSCFNPCHAALVREGPCFNTFSLQLACYFHCFVDSRGHSATSGQIAQDEMGADVEAHG